MSWDATTPIAMAPPHLESTRERLLAYLEKQDWAIGAVVFATSGSTGKPKWVVHTRSSLQVSAVMVNRHLQVETNDCWFLALPEFHVGGFGILARAQQAGCRLARLKGKWNAEDFVKELDAEGATLTSLVPTQVHDLVESSLSPPNSLRAVIVGGGRLTESLGKRARQLGWPVLQSYGMTEAGSQIATESLSHLEKEYSICPLPVLNGWEVQKGPTGILEVRGGALFLGYLREEDSGFCWQPLGGKKWFSTNDVVEISKDGLLFQKRNGREIKVRGELVDVDQLEHLLQEKLASLCKCVLVALPDERVGYRLCPVCVSPESGDGKLETILKEINADLPRFCQLEKPFKLAKLPLSGLGKVNIQALTELLRV